MLSGRWIRFGLGKLCAHECCVDAGSVSGTRTRTVWTLDWVAFCRMRGVVLYPPVKGVVRDVRYIQYIALATPHFQAVMLSGARKPNLLFKESGGQMGGVGS